MLIVNGQAPAAAQAAARITLEDVRAALGEADPGQTNAAKIRATLGRGSFETIQRHLETIRKEAAAAVAPPVPADQVPPAPADAVQQMWGAAWSAAQVQVLRRMDLLSSERDKALAAVQTMSEDMAGLLATVDEQSAALDQAAAVKAAAAAEAAQAAADALAAAQSAQAAAEAQAQAHAALERLLERTQADAVHAAELSEAGRDLLRGELTRMTTEIGELKSRLFDRAAATAPVVPVGEGGN